MPFSDPVWPDIIERLERGGKEVVLSTLAAPATVRERRAVEELCADGRLVEINDITAQVSAAVVEQSAATQEIARSVQEAAQGTAAVDENITGVTAAAGETGAAAEVVRTAADSLVGQSQALRGEVESFLDAVRAA